MEGIKSYDLSRRFWNWAFENPELMSPSLASIYFFAIEHCNRLGGKKKFGFPSQMTMDAVGISKHQTYIKYFNQLVEHGFIEIVQKSKNQYSANIISIPSAMPEKDKALDKAFIKHKAKQTPNQWQSNGQSTYESDGNIDKQVNNEQTNTKKSVGEIEVNLSGGEGEFKDQLLNDLKEVEPKYSETDFLDNWATCRKHFLKQQTFIKSLNFHERTEFDRVKKQYNKEEINAAMQVLFKQERIPVEAMVLRPKHFLEKFDTYYSAGKSTKIYATKQKQTEY